MRDLPQSEDEWRAILTPEQYHILREKGTERAFTGAYFDTEDAGVYRCAGCDSPLFTSLTKFDSGCGWPSFFAALPATVTTQNDYTFGLQRIEVLCKCCGGHLGHVFPDGPAPTGQRYCINSACLQLDRQADPQVKPQVNQ